jgi:hypothetical protein
MANIFLLLFLVIGGVIGWSLFAYTLAQSLSCRKKELLVIEEISAELKKVKEDLKKLK